MKKLAPVLGLLVLLGSTGMASAEGIFVGAGPRGVAVGASFPGFHLVYGRPGVYGWYQGRYYSRTAWDRFYRLQRERIAHYRNHRWNDRDFKDTCDRDQFREYGKGQERDFDRDNYAQNRWNQGRDNGRDYHKD